MVSYFNKIYKVIFTDNLLKKIVKNSGIVFFGNSGASALSFISFALMARHLGPGTLAILVMAQSYAMVVNDIFNIQTWESLVKFGSAQEKPSKTANVIKSNLALDIISAIIATIFAILLVYPVSNFFHWEQNHTDYILIYCISILFNITTLTIAIPRLFDKFSFVAKNQIFFASIKLFLVSVAVYLHKDFSYFIIIYLSIEILTQLSLIFFSFRLISSKYTNWWLGKVQFDKKQIRFIWWTNLRTIVRIPVRRLDVMIINLILSFEMVGIYKVYKEISGILDRLSEPINQTIFPEFAKLIGSSKIKQSKDVAKKTIRLLFWFSLVLTTIMLLLSKPIVSIFFGPAYMSHVSALWGLIIFSWLAFFTTPINSLFLAAGFAKNSFYLVLFTNTIFLLVAFFLGRAIGIYGVIVAFITQGIINQGLKVYLMKKHSSDWDTVIR